MFQNISDIKRYLNIKPVKVKESATSHYTSDYPIVFMHDQLISI